MLERSVELRTILFPRCWHPPDIKKNGGLLQQGRVMQYRFMSDNRDRFSVEEMWECFGLSRIGFYDWQIRRPSQRRTEEAAHKIPIAELPPLHFLVQAK